MKFPLFLAHGFELLAIYLTATALGYLLASLSLWLAWKRKRLIAGILCVPSLTLSAVLASTIHVFWGKLPFAISLAAVVFALFRPFIGEGKKEPRSAVPANTHNLQSSDDPSTSKTSSSPGPRS
ncbi:MAG: hypothetical protein ACOZE5_01900 [Verrucomicrobiota bacterium]